MTKCIECGKEIENDVSAIKIVNGTFKINEFNGNDFEEAESMKCLGFMHFLCLHNQNIPNGKR